jgi:glutamate-1-semialdehyde 2,1-aminomutase
MYVVAIVQARMGSTRLPGKVLKQIVNKPMIELLLMRLSKAKEVDEIIVATSTNAQNDKLQSIVENLGYKCTRGSEDDVLNRYYKSAKSVNADIVVRITGDCPLVDSVLVDECIQSYKNSKVDYFSNTDPVTYPDGLDIEVISFKSIEKSNNETNSDFDREHVTPYIRNSAVFLKSSMRYTEDLSNQRWTVDEPEDLVIVTNIFEHFSPNIFFDWKQVLELKRSQPGLFQANINIINNEGATMGIGQKLYKRAKKIIPGGSMLLSKRPEMFLPEKWPAYFSKSKGCKVWDLDGKEYIDMSIMGIGTNTLGYGHPEVDEAVSRAIKDGNMSTFNCPEEVYLAEKLVEIHPWADMVRFARSGGEINSIAVRIARAATGRDKIAICGYHGWHDWYLSTNLNSDKNLDGHLLPGLQPNGVPRGLVGTTLPFDYNDIDQLEKIIKDNHGEIAAIKMEVSRNEGPKDGYLQKVRELATENNIVLIFDECTSGFRETLGGLHKKFNVDPDLAVFAKALGNGYAISACIGKDKFMQAAQQTFISSTFWTERIGSAAALKTIEVMSRTKSWDKITKIGENIGGLWKGLGDKYSLDMNISGLPAVQSYSFVSDDNIKYKTLVTQEMLKKGFLSTPLLFASVSHSEKIIKSYIEALDECFSLVRDCEDGKSVDSLLDGPVCHSGFKRLN